MKPFWKFALITLALLGVSLRACSLSGGPIVGLVLDEVTKEPIEGAVVAAFWHGSQTKIFGESSSGCYHAETARTDANGKYYIEHWSGPWEPSNLRVSFDFISFSAYKPGYVRSNNVNQSNSALVMLRRSEGDKDEYFETLMRLARLCGYKDGSIKNLYRLLAPVAEEANSLAETASQNQAAKNIEVSRDSTLVDTKKPTKSNREAYLINVNPADGYPKEGRSWPTTPSSAASSGSRVAPVLGRSANAAPAPRVILVSPGELSGGSGMPQGKRPSQPPSSPAPAASSATSSDVGKS